MAEAPARRVWISRGLYSALAIALMVAAFLPLSSYQGMTILWTGFWIAPENLAPPDLLLAMTFAWVVRRPEFVPVWLVAITFFLSDLLFYRPPGLFTATVIAATEVLRARSATLRASGFWAEWLTVSMVLLGAMVVYRAALAITFVADAPLHLAIIQTMLTVMLYPVVAAVSHLVFGVRRVAPGEVDHLGHRL